MLEMTTVGSHTGSQVFGEFCNCLVDVFLWQLFPDGLQGNIQLISCLRLWLEFMVLFQHGATVMIVQWVQIWRVWVPLILLRETRTVCLQPVLYDTGNY